MKRVLLVSDDGDLVAAARTELRRAGYGVAATHHGRTTLSAVRRREAALVIVDLGAARLAALELCRRMRASDELAHTALLVVTGEASSDERIAALEVGADDCIARPLSTRELALRVAAVLRRAAEPPRPVQNVVAYGPIAIDVPDHRVRIDGKEVALSLLEFGLLVELARRPGFVRSRQDLLERVWRYASDVETRTVDTHVMRLRRKLGPVGVNVETVQRIGYRLRDPPRVPRRR